MISPKINRLWKIIMTTIVIVILGVLIVLFQELGQRGKVGSSTLKINSPLSVGSSIVALLSQNTIQEHILSQSDLEKDVTFFLVESLKHKSRLQLSVRFSAESEKGTEASMNQLVGAINQLATTKDFFQEGLRDAEEKLLFAKQMKSQTSKSNVYIAGAVPMDQHSVEISTQRLNTLKEAGVLLTADYSVLRPGGKNMKRFILLLMALVILTGLGAMLLVQATAKK